MTIKLSYSAKIQMFRLDSRSPSSSSDDEIEQSSKKSKVETDSEDDFVPMDDHDYQNDDNDTETDSNPDSAPDYKLKDLRITISKEDQDRAINVIKMEEMKVKYTRPCSVVIRKNSTSSAIPKPTPKAEPPKKQKPGPKSRRAKPDLKQESIAKFTVKQEPFAKPVENDHPDTENVQPERTKPGPKTRKPGPKRRQLEPLVEPQEFKRPGNLLVLARKFKLTR